jgi:hypothetical protein
MKLEVGKYYKNRMGEVCGPVRENPEGSCEYPFKAPCGESIHGFTQDGHWCHGEISKKDLIEECNADGSAIKDGVCLSGTICNVKTYDKPLTPEQIDKKESNRELLERAMNEELSVLCVPTSEVLKVTAIGKNIWVDSDREWHPIEQIVWKIIEPEVAADDLADAAESVLRYCPASTHELQVSYLSALIELQHVVKKYRKQQGDKR